MTDGQSFYLVLALFYLVECLKLCPPDSLALRAPSGKLDSARPRPPFLAARGLKKAVHLAPLLPWPSLLYPISGFSDPGHHAKRLRSASAIRRHHRFLQQKSASLRIGSLYLLLNFFLLIPYLFQYRFHELSILVLLASNYALMLLLAIRFHGLHKRLFPSQAADRIKQTLYTATLPWHAMRCADSLHQSAAAQWSPLAALLATRRHPSSLAQLQRYWRESLHLSRPTFSHALLAQAFASDALDPTNWPASPPPDGAPKYCPSCHANYETQATHCPDCQNTPLATHRSYS